MSPLLIDSHTHIYPPTYLTLLSSRTAPPFLHHPPPTPSDPTPHPRLIILPSDAPSANPGTPPHLLGRPITPSYSSLPSILAFMSHHSITHSILSLANPWLDFLSPHESPPWATKINNELEHLSATSHGRISFFGTLPLTAPVMSTLDEIEQLRERRHCRGVIIGTTGLGSGLDDPALDPVWGALQASKLLVFIHPHYGLPGEVFGPRMQDSGHVLPLSLGFPMETTVAFARMWLGGVFDRFEGLRVMLAHAGGAVAGLADRVQSCVEHERGFYDEREAGSDGWAGGERGRVRGPRRMVREVMRRNVWLDGVSYGAAGLRAAVGMVGGEKVLFGTDHPFFPPLGADEEEGEWPSVRTNVDAIRDVFKGDEEGMRGVMAENAVRLFGLDVPAVEDGGG